MLNMASKLYCEQSSAPDNAPDPRREQPKRSFLEIRILLCEMADSCSYPILGCPLRDLGLLPSCKLRVQFPTRFCAGCCSLPCRTCYTSTLADNGMSSKHSLGVWQFLNLARFAKMARKSHATCGMVSNYAVNDVKLRIPPKFCRVQFSWFRANLQQRLKSYAPKTFGAIWYIFL